MDTIECPRCGHEHEGAGSQEDEGTWECAECGFKFKVFVEWEPIYSTTCVNHELQPAADHDLGNGQTLRGSLCPHCGLVFQAEAAKDATATAIIRPEET